MKKFLVATETATVSYNAPKRVEINENGITIDNDTFSYNQIETLKIDKLTFNFYTGSRFSDENRSSEPERYINYYSEGGHTREFNIMGHIRIQLCLADFY